MNEQTITTSNNRQISQTSQRTKEAKYKRTYDLRFYLYKVQKQAKLTNSLRCQDCGSPGEPGKGREPLGAVWSTAIFLLLDLGDGFTNVFTLWKCAPSPQKLYVQDVYNYRDHKRNQERNQRERHMGRSNTLPKNDHVSVLVCLFSEQRNTGKDSIREQKSSY